ncbi:tRNA (guanine-N(7)-)-methyltransferase [Mycoplasmopsis mustelae]|uniref:tRNA (guanine-N(7)-)-methyltransferase n=1 Tax=Mycoplasmopsis mustelae TaxID=171289 RepID=A0A4R7UBY1_9BACT|nr:tRNA (guanosine(46)-N7)-methyltransferase TrmB [Mycoplasmopsis mustelae]TDV23051.1 tRNA (guanine-N(7)-)-methyltransferase [Mycoplasmopsis mustelae]
MRLRFDNTAQEKLEKSKFYIQKFPINLNLSDIIEIGAGKGEMISQMALLNPDTTFYALEKYQTVALKILKKIEKLKLQNLFIITKDAKELKEIFKNQSDCIWLTFSDPWPKNAHEKRRLTYKTFLNLYREILSNKGKLYFKTDNDKLFEFSLQSLSTNGWKIFYQTKDLHNSEYNNNNIPTDYEIKWSQKGKKINFLIAQKFNK